jgi:hypothetical protein
MLTVFPRVAALVAVVLMAIGWLAHNEWLATTGMVLLAIVLAHWANWRVLVAQSRVVLGLEDQRERERKRQQADTRDGDAS